MENRVVDRYKTEKTRLTGWEEQEILVDMLAASVSKIVSMQKGTIRLYIKQSVNDAISKRNVSFRDIKYTTDEEKTRFVKEIVINTIKRAKLVTNADKIIRICNETYDNWKQKYRPDKF